MAKKYFLLDANVVAGYYLQRCLRSKVAYKRITDIFDSARSKKSDFFFYLPNFCIAEVFSVFAKYTYGYWNQHVKKGTLDTRVYDSLVRQFQDDIHNGKFINQYELSRYHILNINYVAPVNSYYKISRGKKKNIRPMGTLDCLIVAMGIQLVRIHGEEKVVLLSADDRLIDVVSKCKEGLPKETIKKLKLHKAKELTGIAFEPNIFPKYLNLKICSDSRVRGILGSWPLEVGRFPGGAPYRRTESES